MPQNPHPPLSPSLEWLASAIGVGPAQALVSAFGGNPIYIGNGTSARAEKQRSKLARIVGDKAAHTLSSLCGGGHIYIPTCRRAALAERNAGIKSAFERKLRRGEGATSAVKELALQHRLSGRQIWNILGASGTPKPVASTICNRIKSI